MNQASKIVADSLTGQGTKTVTIGGKPYTVHPPVISVICRAVSAFSEVSLEDEYTRLSILGEIPANIPHIISGLAALIAGNTRMRRWKTYRIKQQLQSATLREIHDAFLHILPLIGGDDFFAIATCAKNVTTMVAKPK